MELCGWGSVRKCCLIGGGGGVGDGGGGVGVGGGALPAIAMGESS